MPSSESVPLAWLPSMSRSCSALPPLIKINGHAAQAHTAQRPSLCFAVNSFCLKCETFTQQSLFRVAVSQVITLEGHGPL